MDLYHKWGNKTGFSFDLQFFMLISDRLGGVTPYDDMNLCQKHSQLYLEERNSLTGWAYRSNFTFLI